MKPEETGALAEEAISAYRERDAWGRILPSPAWMDLSPEDREGLFDEQAAARRLEAAVSDEGMSSTAAAVVRRARGIEQLR